MGVFQTSSAGKMGQLGVPGNGVPAEATIGGPIAARPSHKSAVAMHAPPGRFHRFMGCPP